MGIHQMQVSGILHMNCSRSKASDPPSFGKILSCAQNSDSIYLFLCGSPKIETSILFHAEMGEGEGKETGEQKQDKRHSRQKKEEEKDEAQYKANKQCLWCRNDALKPFSYPFSFSFLR